MRAINASVMRMTNRKLLLDHIRRQSISRAELADITGLTRASVTQIIDDLITKGYVRETAVVGRNRLGRRNMQLELCPDAQYIFGVYLDRLHCDVGVVNLSGQILMQKSLLLGERDPEDILQSIADTILQQRVMLDLDASKINGIGFSSTYKLAPGIGELCDPSIAGAWSGIPIIQILHQHTHFPAIAESRANANALDEKFFGAARDTENFVLLHIDENVDAGTFFNGKLYHGTRGLASKFGHVLMDMYRPECESCNPGYLAKYINIPVMLRGTSYDSWARMIADAQHSPEAAAIIERMADFLGPAIISIINALDIEKVILTGTPGMQSQHLVDAVNRRVHSRLLYPTENPPVIAGNIIPSVRLAAMPVLSHFFDAD